MSEFSHGADARAAFYGVYPLTNSFLYKLVVSTEIPVIVFKEMIVNIGSGNER
jgi:hypothetical protein